MHATFSIDAALRYGWNTFMKRPGFFIGITIIVGIVSFVAGAVGSLFGEGAGGMFGSLVNIAITTLVDLGVIAILLKAFDDVQAPTFADMWHPDRYLPYLLATLLMGLIVIIGLVLLIVPGLIAMVLLMFTKFVVVDRNMGAIDALKESARITTGNRFNLFLFILALIAINIVGALLLLVPLLVTIPASSLAMVYAYRTLAHQSSEVVPAPERT
jgi:uncharacterized membrane protein